MMDCRVGFIPFYIPPPVMFTENVMSKEELRKAFKTNDITQLVRLGTKTPMEQTDWVYFHETLADLFEEEDFKQRVGDLIHGALAFSNDTLALNCVLAMGEVCKQKGCTYVAGSKIFKGIIQSEGSFYRLDQILFQSIFKEVLTKNPLTLINTYLERVNLNILCHILSLDSFLEGAKTGISNLPIIYMKNIVLGIVKLASYIPDPVVCQHCLSLVSHFNLLNDEAFKKELLCLFKSSWKETPNLQFVSIFSSIIGFNKHEIDSEIEPIFRASYMKLPDK